MKTRQFIQSIFTSLTLLLCGNLIMHGQDWTLLGNGGTLTTNFLGTTDLKDLVIKTNNAERLRIAAAGNITLGTSSILLGATGGIRILPTIGNTAAGPAYSFNGDVGTGMYRVSAGILAFSTASTERMRINATGLIGIGTNNPLQALHVGKSALIDGAGSALFFGETPSTQFGQYALEYDGATSGFNLSKPAGSTNLAGGSGFQNYIIFANNDGEVGMGVDPSILNNPSNPYRLSVCGSIRAKEVVVETSWCDYVFESNYSLRPLSEVKSFIQENKHLPEVPSEAEVKENGVSVGNMESILLLKIEELTLYMIELNEKNEELEKQLIELKNAKN